MISRVLSKTTKEALLIFDGDCGFCSSSVNWLAKNLRVMPEAQPWQFLDLDEYGLTASEASERVWLVTPGRGNRLGKQYGGHLAVSALLRHQPQFGVRLLGWIMRTPPFSLFAAAGYAVIARYRHKLPGGTPACAVRSAQ